MGKLKQAHIDAVITEFKTQLFKKVGVRSFAMAAVCDRAIINEISCYELEILPTILAQGFTAPTASELFGVKLSIKEYCND